MWWNRSESPRSSTRHAKSARSRARATGYAQVATGVKVAGAANSPTAATRNRPVVRLLKRMSKTTSVCHSGGLVTMPAYPVGLGRLVFVCISSSPQEERGERYRERDRPGDCRAEVVSQHVEPRIEGGFRQPDRKSTRLNSSHSQISYAVFCLK